MSRNLTVAIAAAITAEQVTRTIAVKLAFDSGTVFACGAPFNVVIGADTYLGIGSLGSISTIEEASDVQSTSVTIALAGIPRAMVTLAMTENYQNRAATIREVLLDPVTEAVIADPVITFIGRMDTMTVALDATTATVAIACTNRLADWERPSNSRYSDEEQQRTHSGDLGLQYAAFMATRSTKLPTVRF